MRQRRRQRFQDSLKRRRRLYKICRKRDTEPRPMLHRRRLPPAPHTRDVPHRRNPNDECSPRAPSLRFARGLLRTRRRRAAAQDRACLAQISAAARGCALRLWRAALRCRRTRPGRALARIRGRIPSQVRRRPGLSAQLRALRGRLSSCR